MNYIFGVTLAFLQVRIDEDSFQIHKNKTRKLMKRIKELDTFYNCTMAAIYEYIILSVIGITVYKSAAYNINKTICLEKAASLLENENRCRLDLLYTEIFLNDAGTCLRKCSVHINNLNYRKTYFLREVNVTIGTNEKFTKSVCQQSDNTHVPMYMHIECLLWNEDKYRVIHNYNYPFNNSECVGINNHNICHCYDGYTIVNGYCIKGNIAVGGSCEHNKQCTGTADANICRSRKCTCQTGYILIENNCYEGNIPVGYFCVHDEQCTQTRFASLCRSSVCTCQTGYTIVDNTCYKGNMTINQPCLHNRQCTGTKSAGLCSSGKCSCDTGHMLIDNNCYKDNSIGRILGILFGGIIIGVILTAVVAFLIFKKLRTKIKKRK